MLLSTIQPWFWNDFLLTYVLCVFWAQLLLIPGLAALFSRLMYGPSGWYVRALWIVVATPVGLAGLGALIFGIALPLDWIVSVLFAANPQSWIDAALSILTFLVLVVGVTFALWIAYKRSAKKSVELESARWLRERQSGIDAQQREWRNRGIRWALWIPGTVVLAVFLFLPEIVGLMSNLRQPHEVQLGSYTIHVPRNWVIFDHWTDNNTGQSDVFGVVGIGARLDFRRYFHSYVPLSSWNVSFRGSDPPSRAAGSRLRDSERVVAQRVIQIGDERITCVEFTNPYYDPSGVGVECSGSRLFASIRGEPAHLRAFYQMLEQTTRK